MILATVLFLFLLKYRPVRMDYSLFLRASKRYSGRLPIPTPCPLRVISTGANCLRSRVSWDSGGS